MQGLEPWTAAAVHAANLMFEPLRGQDKFDLDGGGTLDLDELKAALSRLQDAARLADRELTQQRKASAEAWRSVRAAQIELKVQISNEREAALAKKEAADAAAWAKAEAEEAARTRKAEAVAEAKRRKLEEKAAFDAKVAERRRATCAVAKPVASAA